MAEAWELYEGIISPQGGLYKPGPEVVFPSSSQALTSRSVTTVPIDTSTGMPFKSSAFQSVVEKRSEEAKRPTEEQMRAIREVPASIPASLYTPDVQVSRGSEPRLAPMNGYGPSYPFGYSPGDQQTALGAINKSVQPAQTAASGTVGFGNPSLAASVAALSGRGGPSGNLRGYMPTFRPQSPLRSDVIKLVFDPMSNASGIGMANSSGKPIQGPNGTIYYPNGATKPPGVPAPVQALANASPPAPPTQSTQAQEDRFQWTDNTYLPPSVASNPRWSGR